MATLKGYKMKTIKQRLLKSLWMNQTKIIRTPGQANSAIQILSTGRLWAKKCGVSASDQNKAIEAASQGQPFNSIVFSFEILLALVW